jgi:branched-chain amino acid transport system permease protein
VSTAILIVTRGVAIGPGAIVGGIAIGVLQTAAAMLLSGHVDVLGAGYSAILPYVVAVAVLAVRPSGLFGARDVRRI